jgi:phage FluMu protein gp41
MITGFAAICQYLQELDKLSKISQLSGQHHDSKTINRNFSLVPLEHQRNVFETVDQTFSNQMPAGKLVNLYKTPNKNYSVAEMRGLDFLTGDIVLLYKEQHPVSIAIIRQQGSNDLNNTKQLLLDHIVGGCTIRNLSDSKHHGFAIVVAEGGEQQQVFLPPGKYLLNNDINLLIDRAMQLTACLESNEFYARFHFKYA